MPLPEHSVGRLVDKLSMPCPGAMACFIRVSECDRPRGLPR